MATIKFAMGLLLLLCLLGSISPLTPAVADPDEVKWSRVNIPTEGKAGNWVLAKGSDVAHLTMAIDGTLYAHVTGFTYTLYKSTDEGRSWSYTGEVTNAIVDIATIRNDASTIYYATPSSVYKSTDAGSSFTPLPPNPGGAGSNNIEITSIDAAPLGSINIIAVGTRDTDNGEYGGVYILDENELPLSWIASNIGSYDVYAVAFSPNFTADRQLVAVVTDETDTFVTTKISDADWGKTVGDARLDKDNSEIPTSVAVATSADIAFPSDYDASTEDYVLFVAIDAGGNNGDVYRINGVAAPGSSVATDLNIGSAYGLSNVDVTALAVTGDASSANLLAGTAGSGQIYFSTDGGTNWVSSAKPPTGGSKTYGLMAPDFISSGEAYAVTSGIESAFSYTTDGGVTWNQLGLIDTGIQTILDLAVSPNYSQDDTLFMLTWGGEHSLWRSLNGGTRWERVFTSALANVDSINLVELSPQYSNISQVVFLAGIGNGNPAIWKSIDNGQNFSPPRLTDDPTTGAPFPIDIWAVVNDDTLFIGSFDAINNQGLVYRTTDSGLTYSTPAVVGDHPLSSIALSPNYEQDGFILLGSTDGWVYWSNDNGTSFEPLPPDATSPPLTGNISVAFALRFSSNSTVYAASDTPDSDIYHFIIGESNNWQGIDSTLPDGAIIDQLMTSADGVLYATNSKADGGMERCLNPSYSPGPTFETVTRGLDDGATLAGLWLSKNKLWSVDSANTRLMTFTDSLAVSVTLTSPPDQALGIDTRNVNLEWRSASGATKYEWQLDYDTDFSNAYQGFEGDTKVHSARLPTLNLATTYYWRVRVTEPLLSPWSATGSFTTSLVSSVIAPNLRTPGAGAKSVGLRPVFQWSAIAGAESYDLLVSTDVYFVNPIIKRVGADALPATAWQSDISLDYDTTYYWKVRASGSGSYSAWSAVSAFTTRSSPALEPSPAIEPSPALEPLSIQLTAPELYSPGAGVRGMPLKPIFQWSAIAGADSYELLVATDASFTNPIIIKIGAHALPATAWQSDISLGYDATYYWRVRGIGSNTHSAWSAVSAFTTESPPQPPPPSPQPTIPDWAKYLAGGLLLTMVAILTTMIILTVKVFRL